LRVSNGDTTSRQQRPMRFISALRVTLTRRVLMTDATAARLIKGDDRGVSIDLGQTAVSLLTVKSRVIKSANGEEKGIASDSTVSVCDNPRSRWSCALGDSAEFLDARYELMESGAGNARHWPYLDTAASASRETSPIYTKRRFSPLKSANYGEYLSVFHETGAWD
jgi:hypothetical protein